MGDDIDKQIHSLPLSCLPLRSRELLSCLLDTKKLIPNNKIDKLPRDWRGLAHLVNISAEIANYIDKLPQKTKEVLDIWQRDQTATVGQLLKHLERLDRYDVYDDLYANLKESIVRREFVVNVQNQVAINNNNNVNHAVQSNIITIDDYHGYEHHYDAFVLYANEDRHFANELLERMTDAGLQLCTVDRLLPGHTTEFAPVTQLIYERCKRIILICSPDFFNSQTNNFYRDYAQAVSIESTKHKIIPIVYRECLLPTNVTFYHKLYYNKNDERAIVDFWTKLQHSLYLARGPMYSTHRIGTTTSASQPQIRIEMPSSKQLNSYYHDDLFLPTVPQSQSRSTNDIHSLSVTLTADSNSLSSVSQQSVSSCDKKKKHRKKNIIVRIQNLFKSNNTKEAVMVAH